MPTYRVFYMGHYKKTLYSRDDALKWIAQEVKSGGGDFHDYEILDNSDR